MILTIDEAHTLDQSTGRLLLGTCELIRCDAPFLMILAGAPNLQSHLDTINDDFWFMRKHLRLGLLSKSDTETTLVEPFKQRDIRFDENTLNDIVEDTRGYPCFIHR